MEKVWIYMADRFLSESEVDAIKLYLQKFISQWNSHGNQLHAETWIEENLFLIFKVDENLARASGCSVDSLNRFIKIIEQELNINFFDRQRIAFRSNNHVQTLDFKEFKLLFEEGKVDLDTIVYNPLVSNQNELNVNWQLPLSKSWHRRILGI
jgi:hypothetical protein